MKYEKSGYSGHEKKLDSEGRTVKVKCLPDAKLLPVYSIKNKLVFIQDLKGIK